jgi:hypothetical protein
MRKQATLKRKGGYKPAQRRVIDVGIAEAEADIKAGRVSQAFSSHREFTAALHHAAAKRGANKTKSPAK